ncbi:hypothetical protein L195_g023891 [Trifolium pratense]|uniref:Uncharacterized protein n=1 Tax=Trifolium pratense TaxID=57577 RepID=A0A2K3NC51_TRIPR|nr:hypothetical protein L195_g023891 [Trifolium pratense]
MKEEGNSLLDSPIPIQYENDLDISILQGTTGIGTNSAESHSLCRRWPSQGQRTGDNSTYHNGFYFKATQVTARGRGRKNLGRGRSSLVIDCQRGEWKFFRINGLNEALRCASRLCLFVPVSVRVGWEPNKTSQALSLVRPFTNYNTETENSRCPKTDATKQVKDNRQYSWIGKTNSHSRKRTVDDCRPGRNRKRG